MYLIALGEFSMDGYKEGTNTNLAFLFFILATFFCLVVFINMLIAIMSETFSVVQSVHNASALYEQV